MTDFALMANPVSTFIGCPVLPEPTDQASCLPVKNDDGDEHIYTNVAEMAEINNRPMPPSPRPDDLPLRTLNGGWQEYQTHAGRSYFFHAETKRCQWNPPRFLRSPAQVQAFMAANGGISTDCEKEDVMEADIRNADKSPRMPKSTTLDLTRDRRSLKCVAVPLAPVLPMSNSMHNERCRSEERGTKETDETFFFPSPASSPLTHKATAFEHEPNGDSSHLRTIKCGTMEKALDISKKKEWTSAYMYLTSAHLILYKDEKSAEKHGKHYAAPLGVCDLKGATVAFVQREKRKRKVIELLLSTGSRLYLRSATDVDVEEWHDSLKDVIRRLPAGTGVGMLDHSSALVRTSSLAGRAPMAESLLVEQTPSRESVIERLMRFFRNRPSMDQLKQKGIYKHEAVFGSTLACISSQEGGALVPKFIRVVTELIEARGIDTDGIYRVSGNLSAIQKIRCSIDQDKYSLLVNETDVHVLSGCLKLFFRELSESVFPPPSTKAFLAAVKLTGKSRLKKFDELLKEMPAENRETLKYLLRHLERVASHCTQNRMQVHNLAIVFGPTLFSSDEPRIMRKGDKGKTVKAGRKSDDSRVIPVQSNSHLAYNLIMQGQIVEILLSEHSKIDSLKGPPQIHPS